MKRPIESDYTSHVAYTRALEEYCDALAQPAEQEPVAWLGFNPRSGAPEFACDKPAPSVMRDYNMKPLVYINTTPPQRTWVGLTDEEISDIAINNPPMVHEFARAIEAKLRSKNT
jgi:hypothetical protein